MPHASVAASDAPAAIAGEIGNQIHNIGCELHGNEELADRLADLASRTWALARTLPTDAPAPTVAEAPPSWAQDPWNGNSAASCPDCGAWHEVVRPGKTQPTCECADTEGR